MIKYHYDIEQGSPPWLAMRRAIITASNISKILTPNKLEMSKSTGYLHEFCRQKVDDMPYGAFSTRHTDRGHIEETLALQVYHAARISDVKRCGFVENVRHGFKIGCSPDALVGDAGIVEVKSFAPNIQFGNIVDDTIEKAHMLQVQMELLVTERAWCDFIHMSSGTHQIVTRVYPDTVTQAKIKEACHVFYNRVDETMGKYYTKIADKTRFFPTAYVAGLYDQPEEEITND